MKFEFATAGRILFGPGTAAELPAVLRACGNRPLLVTGANPDRHRALLHGTEIAVFVVPGEPDIDLARAGAALARQAGCNSVVAIGGGSAIDAGKAIAALATNPGDVLDYLEVIGKAQQLSCDPLPFVAVPTTAGTGSEVTRNAVLGSKEHRVKASLRSPRMLPHLALVDSNLTMGLPSGITASTGLDALTQLIEPFVTARATPFTDALCREAIPRAYRNLPRVVADGRNAEAREQMALASLFGGLALANAGLGAVHGFAAPIGGAFPAPHGAVCAILLPHVVETNVAALRRRAPGHPALDRYAEVGFLLTGTRAAEAAVEALAMLGSSLGIAGLKSYGIREAELTTIAGQARKASSMKANPIDLTDSELLDILRSAL